MAKLVIILLALFSGSAAFAQDGGKPSTAPELKRVEPSAVSGFLYPYYLLVPSDIKAGKTRETILVLPNNTGKVSDDLNFHEEYIKRRSGQFTTVAAKLGVIVLVPVFPRPETDWQIYTHALDRDSLVTGKKEFSRFDKQLVAMIDHARRGLEKQEIATDKRVLIMGFSAAGMFANRFAFLHPDRVKGAAIGAPGGWPIVPAATFNEKSLRYPIGIADLKETSGRSSNLKSLRKVPFFIYMGDGDDNDSVTFTDGYDVADKELIFSLFGETPISRWEKCKKLYEMAGMTATFKLYPGVKHMATPAMYNDSMDFLRGVK